MSENNIMTGVRPQRLTPEMAMRVACQITTELAKNGLIDAKDIETSTADIAKHGRLHIDGYRLAKDLDRFSNWDCNLEIAEGLDNFSRFADAEISAAEKEWADANAISPHLPIGTRVQLRSGETGIITGIYEYGAAKFLILIDGDKNARGPSNSRSVVNFEDAQAIGEP